MPQWHIDWRNWNTIKYKFTNIILTNFQINQRIRKSLFFVILWLGLRKQKQSMQSVQINWSVHFSLIACLYCSRLMLVLHTRCCSRLHCVQVTISCRGFKVWLQSRQYSDILISETKMCSASIYANCEELVKATHKVTDCSKLTKSRVNPFVGSFVNYYVYYFTNDD